LNSADIIRIASNAIKKYGESLNNPNKYVNGSELKIAYEIMKIELGEPILITKNGNENIDTFIYDVTDPVDKLPE